MDQRQNRDQGNREYPKSEEKIIIHLPGLPFGCGRYYSCATSRNTENVKDGCWDIEKLGISRNCGFRETGYGVHDLEFVDIETKLQIDPKTRSIINKRSNVMERVS